MSSETQASPTDKQHLQTPESPSGHAGPYVGGKDEHMQLETQSQ